jgi:hypothetical protein
MIRTHDRSVSAGESFHILDCAATLTDMCAVHFLSQCISCTHDNIKVPRLFFKCLYS